MWRTRSRIWFGVEPHYYWYPPGKNDNALSEYTCILYTEGGRERERELIPVSTWLVYFLRRVFAGEVLARTEISGDGRKVRRIAHCCVAIMMNLHCSHQRVAIHQLQLSMKKKTESKRFQPWSFCSCTSWGKPANVGRKNLLAERRTCNRKVASSIPGKSEGTIFFSKFNFLCWLLFGVRTIPRFNPLCWFLFGVRAIPRFFFFFFRVGGVL